MTINSKIYRFIETIVNPEYATTIVAKEFKTSKILGVALIALNNVHAFFDSHDFANINETSSCGFFIMHYSPYFQPVKEEESEIIEEVEEGGDEPVQEDVDEIVEVLQSEAGFTTAVDPKPIVATYECDSCVAVGGYIPLTNPVAFMVHFAIGDEVRKCGRLIFENISKLTQEKVEAPIQLHLRGGIKGVSEDTVEAIKMWMHSKEEFPMEIASEDILRDPKSHAYKSLFVDSRTGEVGEYDNEANPYTRRVSDEDRRSMASTYFFPRIKVIYP